MQVSAIARGAGSPWSVNVSSRQVRQGNLVETVAAALDETGLEARYLEIELTEGTLIDDTELARRTLERLRTMGVRIAIDDFGTGYSSLSYVQRFSIDALKIDRTFVQDITANEDAAALSAAIIGLATSLRLDVIAEGVETTEQLKVLMDLGCTTMQGFLFARPLNPAGFSRFSRPGPQRATRWPRFTRADVTARGMWPVLSHLTSQIHGSDIAFVPIEEGDPVTRARIRPAIRLSAVLAIAAAALTPAAAAAAAPAPISGVDLVFVTGSVGFPIDVDAPIGDERVFIADKAGTVEIWQDGALLPDPYLDIRDVVFDSGERGLLGIAFAPDYADSGKFYVDYIETGSSDSVIVEYEVLGGDPNAIDEGTRRELLRVGQPNSNHNGGALAFGPDGYLYIALGDGGSQNDPSGNGQNMSTLLSTIVRIDPVTAAAPGSNPFVGAPGADEIWAYGFRNPWRISFDAATGDLYIGDVGQADREEVDYIPAGVGGGNYGWRIEEGSFCHRDEGVGCGSPALIRPVFEYDNTGGGGGSGAGFDGCSVTGGYVYRGNALPQLRGHYFYADACQSWVRSFRGGGRSGRRPHQLDRCP